MRIGIYGEMFAEWGGGVDFLRLITKGLHAMPDAQQHKFFIFIPVKTNTTFTYIKFYLKKLFNLLPFKKKYTAILPKPLNLEHIKKLLVQEGDIEMVVIREDKETLAQMLAPYRLDVMLPCFHPMPQGFTIPWIGYLYDFQHVHLPHFFSEEERTQRDVHFTSMVQNAKAIIVNAKAVKNDAIQYLNADAEKIFALPFCPLYGQEEVTGSITHFNLPKKFFLVSNQFWKHKDHSTVFRGLKAFYEDENYTDVHLVCTGEMHDYRFPEYAHELKQLIKDLGIEKQVHLLGYINKQEQVLLMQQCIAVIQPTLFEGGPGGGVVYEALARNKRVVLSDIAVNQEIEDARCKFFRAGDPADLAQKLVQTVTTKQELGLEDDQLKERQTKALAQTLAASISFVTHQVKLLHAQ